MKNKAKVLTVTADKYSNKELRMSFKIFFTGQVKRNDWDCFSWSIHLGDQTFEYFTGLGHATKSNSSIGLKPKDLTKKVIRSKDSRDETIFIHVPKLKDILYSLAMDSQSGNETFEDFCSNCGYDTDSRKALETYLACQESNQKLRRVMKSKNYLDRILAWEL